MTRWRFWLFFVLVVLGGGAVAWAAFPVVRPLRSSDAALLMIIGLLALLEMGPLIRGRIVRWHTASSSLMFVFALLVYWGLAAAIIGQAVNLVVAASLNGRAHWRTVFNLAQFAICFGAAELVLTAFGHHATLAAPAAVHAALLLPLLIAGVAWFATNSLLVGTLISLEYGESWWKEVSEDVASLVALNDGAAIAMSPLVVLAAERSVWLVPLLLIPLFAVYKSNMASVALKHQAGHDALTSLPNRTSLVAQAKAAFADVAAGESELGLFVLDLDRFKEINDTLGHPAGDRLLMVVADRLLAAVRPGDLVARLGGDEFAVLLPDLGNGEGARGVAARITTALRAPMRVDGVILSVDSSLGMAFAPDHGIEFETLLQRADLAMYSAKGLGTSFEVYTPELSSGSVNRLNLLGDLRVALDHTLGAPLGTGGHLVLHYQPQISLDAARPVGVEALLRWTHPVRGLVSSEEFIAKVEHSELMGALTHWVVDQAVAQAASWLCSGLGTRVAVNVSVTDLQRPDFATYVAERLAHHGVDARWLQLEITESALMVHPRRTLATLKGLESLGVSLSLDDFGTGYSSMSQLHWLPVTEIKIDRSFITNMGSNSDNHTIVRSMIELGRALGKRVVAEGVEDQATLVQLREMGCHEAQGWHVSPAMPGLEITAWLRDRQPQPASLDRKRPLRDQVNPAAPVG
ncbi:MAG: EAL domain-containing protein [Mycobacteriales bacterium]